MRSGFRKFVSLFLTICLFLTSCNALASDVDPEIGTEATEEMAVAGETVQEEAIEDEPAMEAAVSEKSVAEAPVAEELAAKESVASEPAVEELAAEATVAEEPAAKESEAGESAVEEPAAEAPVAAEPVEEPDAEVPAAEEQVEESAVDEPAVEVAGSIDPSKPVSQNAVFDRGYVTILEEIAVYADQNGEEKVALLKAGLLEAMERINAGKDGDMVLVRFAMENEVLMGYVRSDKVRPATEEEIGQWNQGNEAVKGNLIRKDSEVSEIAVEDMAASESETAVAGDPAEETPVTETEVTTIEQIETEVSVESEPAGEEIEIAEVVEVEKELSVEEEPVIEEELLIEEEKQNTEATVSAEEADDIGEEELTDEVEDTVITLDAAYAVAGDVQLEVGTTSLIPIPKGINAQAYAAFDMETAGLLTITFKSVSAAHGNVMVSIKDTKDVVLWSTMWASNVGTVNYSAFVEADSYVIIIEKTDSDDDASYVLSAEPIVSKTGETGTRNNTQNNAATLTVDGTSYTGIISQQDVRVSRFDYYKFTLSSPGYVQLQYTNLSMSNLTFALYGDDTSTENEVTSLTQAVVGTFDRNEMQTISVNRNGWLDAGVYYVEVSRDGTLAPSTDGRYRISVSLNPITITEKERNNTFQQAYDVENMLPLNDTVITSLLGESDTVDCYDFYLAVPTRISVSLKIQFSGVTAAIYSRDGKVVPGSSFGATGTTGSEGNPYELELNKFRLEGGYYYVRISRSGSSTGKYSISAHTSITASKLKAETSSTGEKATLTASVSAYGSTWKSFLYIYEDTGSGAQLVDAYEYANVYDIVKDYYPAASGNYAVQFVVTDGVNWDELWDSFTCTVRDFNITTISASTDANGNVHCIASYTGNSVLKGSVASWYLNGVLIDSVELNGGREWIFKAPVSGTYSIQFAGTLTGTTWKDGWTMVDVEAPSPVLPLVVSALNVSSTNTGVINCSAETKEGIQAANAMFVLYKAGTEIARTQLTAAKTGSFRVSASGNYTVQCVAYDGATWAEKWENVTVSLSSGSVLTVKSLSATADEDGKGIISMTGTTQGGGALVSSTFYLYSNNKVIGTYPSANGMATAPVYQSGTYAVQYVVSDGARYADKWASVSVTLNSKNQPVQITSLIANADASGAITMQADYTASRSLQQLNYYIYDATDKVVNVQYSTNSKQAKLYVTKSGTYKVQAVAFDGEVWDDMWKTVTVSLSGGTATTLTVNNLAVTSLTPTSFYLVATTNDSRALLSSTFYVYQGGKVVRTIPAPNKETTVTGIPVGNYSVQYVAYDGMTWAEKWAAVSAGASTLAVNLMNVTKIGNYYVCNATITNNMDIQAARYVLYDASDKQIAAWYWDGTGSYVDHTFLIDSALTVAKVQYVVFDGVKWVDAWDTP